MSKTRTQVLEQGLRNLMVIAEGQTVSQSDMDKIDLVLDGVCGELADLHIFYVGDRGVLGPSGGDFDDSAYLSIADYLAYRALSVFPMGADGQTRLMQAATEAERRLRALSGPPRTRRELRVDPGTRQNRITTYAPFPNNF